MANSTSTNGSDGDAQGATNNQNSSAQGATSTAQGGASSTAITTSTPVRSLEELERLNAELIRDNAAYRRKAKEQADAAAQAEQARLAEQGQFKQLAEQHSARVKELEPIAESYTRLAEQIKQQILQDTKDWPAEIKAFYPGDNATAEQLQDWYNRSKPLLERLQQQARGAQAGNRPNPPAAGGQPNRADVQQANRQAFVKQRNYGM